MQKEKARDFGKILGMVVVALLIFVPFTVFASFLQGLPAHIKYLYPIVRVTFERTGGSGTIVYSRPDSDGTAYNTYIITNHHVIADAVNLDEKWDSDLQKKIKIERFSIVYVESFEYRDMSIPIGTRKVEADIVLYNEEEDVALLKLRTQTVYPFVANLVPADSCGDYKVFDDTVAVGCSVGWPPLPTPGIISRRNFQIQSHPYDMSTSQIIYGNSGGAMFLGTTGHWIGIPSRIAAIGWGTPITHMGHFIPACRVYDWLKKEHYDFIFDQSKKECDSLKDREDEIAKKKKRAEQD